MVVVRLRGVFGRCRLLVERRRELTFGEGKKRRKRRNVTKSMNEKDKEKIMAVKED